MIWVTREDVKIDRIATAWLIRRFVDRGGEIRFVPGEQVQVVVAKEGATAFHVRGGEFAKHDDRTGFEELVDRRSLADANPALKLMAEMVNAADTVNALVHQPAGAGLRAISEGFRSLHKGDDQAVVAAMEPVLDALYAYCEAHVH
jgi:hypothetical protein